MSIQRDSVRVVGRAWRDCWDAPALSASSDHNQRDGVLLTAEDNREAKWNDGATTGRQMKRKSSVACIPCSGENVVSGMCLCISNQQQCPTT